MTTRTSENLDTVRRQIEAYRRQKDKWMQESPDSPLDAEQRAAFTGLKYYPVDLSYRVPAVMERSEEGQTLRIQTTTEEWRDYNHYGLLKFELQGQPYTLHVFQPTGENVHKGARELFTPFRDRTAPRETYGAGRYLELRAQDNSDEYMIDFNRSSNPWCAYSPNYCCTVPPPSNFLPLEIRAGEKLFQEH